MVGRVGCKVGIFDGINEGEMVEGGDVGALVGETVHWPFDCQRYR